MPLGYSESDKYLKPKSKPEMDMLWIGGENDSNKNQGTSRNTRKNLIKKYFGNVPYKAKVIGRWSEETVNELKEEVDFMGAQGKHGDAYGYFNDSLTTLWSGSISTKETGLIPTRPIMALRSGSIVLSEKDMYGVQTLIPDKYLIDSKESAINIIKELKLLSIEEREKICKEILSNFKQWKEFDWKNIFGIK